MTTIVRDRYDRPLIIPLGADGQPDLEAKPVPYKRPSKFAKMTDDTFQIMLWYQRTTALGLYRRKDLRNQVKLLAEAYEDPLNHPAAKATLKKVCQEAHLAGGGEDASNTGTFWHECAEKMFTYGWSSLPDNAPMPRMFQLRKTLADAGIEVLECEVFVVNDFYKAAGTFDYLLKMPDGSVRVGDLKTGTHDADYPSGVASQVRTYAKGQRYNPETGDRTMIHPALDHSMGLLVHLPQQGDGCHLHNLHLDTAEDVLNTAFHVDRVRKLRAKAFISPYVGGGDTPLSQPDSVTLA